MKGTEKQIKWAEDIKRETIANINNAIKANNEIGMFDAETELLTIMVKAVEIAFNKIDDAAIIINRRHLFSIDTIQANIRKALAMINAGKLTVDQFAKANGVNR